MNPADLVAELDGERLSDNVAGAARQRADAPGVVLKDGTTEVTSPLLTAILSPDELLRQHGMDPSEWEILEAKVNRWDAAGMVGDEWAHTDLHQIKVRVRPKRAPPGCATTRCPTFRDGRPSAPTRAAGPRPG